MLREPAVWSALMDRLTDGMIRYLQAQVAAGADVIQVFDSWVGSLAPADYERSVLPWMRRIFDALRPMGAPTIHFGTGNAALLELMASAGSDVMSVDWRVRPRRRLAAHRLRARHPGQPGPGAAAGRLGGRSGGHARGARAPPAVDPATSSTSATA